MYFLIRYEFTSCFTVQYEFTLFFAESLSFSRIYYVFIPLIADSVRIHLMFRESIINPLSFSPIQHELTIYSANSLSISQLNYKYTFCYTKFTINSISLSPINREFTIYSANSLWIYYQLRELTLRQILISRLHCLFRTHYLFRENTIN